MQNILIVEATRESPSFTTMGQSLSRSDGQLLDMSSKTPTKPMIEVNSLTHCFTDWKSHQLQETSIGTEIHSYWTAVNLRESCWAYKVTIDSFWFLIKSSSFQGLIWFLLLFLKISDTVGDSSQAQEGLQKIENRLIQKCNLSTLLGCNFLSTSTVEIENRASAPTRNKTAA